LAGVLIATETFRPLVLAQAKARKLDPHLVVVRHPVGGLNASEPQLWIDLEHFAVA
jgi:hypothetical protein